jgi:sulfur carrier protein ThiS
VAMVKLILRDKEFELRPGMTLLDALKKSNILSEGVLCTRSGELITEDEILKDGDIIRIISAISGG